MPRHLYGTCLDRLDGVLSPLYRGAGRPGACALRRPVPSAPGPPEPAPGGQPMQQAQPHALARSLGDFFHEYLPGLRGMSPHTIHSYRDTFVLLLRFLAATKHLNAAAVDLEHLDPQTIIAYLTYLEEARHNQATTRNVRLAAIHAFFRYVAARHPERLEQAQRILGIPFKRTSSQPIDYLEAEEIQTLLASIDRGT